MSDNTKKTAADALDAVYAAIVDSAGYGDAADGEVLTALASLVAVLHPIAADEPRRQAATALEAALNAGTPRYM